MSLIKNLIKEHDKPKSNKKDDDSKESTEDEKPKLRPFIKSATDLQRLRLEKLMKNPDKAVVIPEQRREKDYMQMVPTFVRNVMGSSAGAGSGEFHVYRHLRRKEYARQKTIQAKSLKEQLDDEYQQKLEDNRRLADEKTAKKRAKRMKKKQRVKKARKQTDGNCKANQIVEEKSATSESSDDEVIPQEENLAEGDSKTSETAESTKIDNIEPPDDGLDKTKHSQTMETAQYIDKTDEQTIIKQSNIIPTDKTESTDHNEDVN